MSLQDTVTVYFCGSGNNRNQSEEFLVPYLFKNTVGADNDHDPSAVIYSGPGGNKYKDEIGNKVKDKRKKVFYRATKKHLLNGQNRAQGVQAAKQLGSKTRWYNTAGGANGTGAVSNVMQAWIWLADKLENRVFRPKNINLVGFSRGAYSCIILSKILQNDPHFDPSEVNVNIFAFDPVPGGLNNLFHAASDEFYRKRGFKKAFNLGDNDELPVIVKNYYSIVQANILRWDKFSKDGWFSLLPKDHTFQCIVPDQRQAKEGQEIRIYPMPGVHRASVSIFEEVHKHSLAVGRHLCEQFLIENGTELVCNNRLSPKRLLFAYHKLLEQYKKGGTRKAPSKHRAEIIQKQVNTNGEWLNSNEFVNAHHKAVATGVPVHGLDPW